MNLYVHIPFCPKICPYCSFYKEESGRGRADLFICATLRELERFTAEKNKGLLPAPETIFFGGGTPTALSTPQLERLIIGLRERLDLSHLQEWTIEMNPATVSLEKALLLRSLGVTRVSMGVQSWDNATLAILGRVHSKEQAERSFHILRQAGFDNINLDHIFAAPGQDASLLLATLRRSIALQPEHISAYCLTYEEDTEYLERLHRGDLIRHPELEVELFAMTIQTLEHAGYLQYEISNFAPPGRECRHNLGYWRGVDYLGLGPSAVSTIASSRWRNIRNTNAWMTAVESGVDPADYHEELSPQTRDTERIVFGLRLSEGIPVDVMTSRFAQQIKDLQAEGLAELYNNRLRLTTKGRLLADEIGTLFV